MLSPSGWRALEQLDAEVAIPGDKGAGTAPGDKKGDVAEGGETRLGDGKSAPPSSQKPRRYHGTVSLDPTRVGRDAGRIADELIAHLARLVGSTVMVIIEIEAALVDLFDADAPSGWDQPGVAFQV